MKYVKTYRELNLKSALATRYDIKNAWEQLAGIKTYIKIVKSGSKYLIKVFANI